jgi:peptide deformylase
MTQPINYEIITVPHPVLKQTAQEVAHIDDMIRTQLKQMLSAMYDANGIGLAANQVGLLNRVLVMDLQDRDDPIAPKTHKPIFMVNPQLVWQSEEKSAMDEGCLSIPGMYANVERPAEVRVQYWDYEGNEQILSARGLLSHCVQHEIDHLNGILFVDHLSALKRNMILRKFAKIQKTQKIL